MIKGEYKPKLDSNGNEIDQSDEENDDGEEDEKEELTKDTKSSNDGRTRMKSAGRTRSKSKGKSTGGDGRKGLKSWFFVCESQFQYEMWIAYLVHNIRVKNPKFTVSAAVLEKLKASKVVDKSFNLAPFAATATFNINSELTDGTLEKSLKS